MEECMKEIISLKGYVNIWRFFLEALFGARREWTWFLKTHDYMLLFLAIVKFPSPILQFYFSKSV